MAVGDTISFYVDFVVTDGMEDSAYAALITGTQVAPLFNGISLVTPLPFSNNWSPLGDSSGTCVGNCGSTGWTHVTYVVGTAGTAYLQFGATNIYDDAFDTGLAVGDITVPSASSAAPEPSTWLMLLAGGPAIGLLRRNRNR